MSVLPIVSPANNADGIALMPVIKAIYPFALDEGSITSTNCFLVKKVSSLGTNKTEPVAVKVTPKRIQLASEADFVGVDLGDDAQAGQKYRTLIELTPASQLDTHTEYSVILSKELGKNSVFDVWKTAGTSTKFPLVKGPYTGLIDNTYTIEVVTMGNEGTAKYKVTRESDGHIFSNLVAKKRFIELEKGIFIKFDTASYYVGDIYKFNVKPLIKTNEIYSWNFTTGSSTHVVPSDESSDVVVGLPIENPQVIDTTSPFKLLSISPADNTIMHDPTKKTVTFTFNKNINPSSITDEKIKIIVESTTTNYYGSIEYSYAVSDNKIIITFQ